MAKQQQDKTIFICGECGYESPKWMGKCPACGSWNTMVEEKQVKVRPSAQGGVVQHLSEVSVMQSTRISTGLSELDRVTGGGLLAGMVFCSAIVLIRFFNDTIIHNEDYLLNTYTAPVLATIPDLTAKTPKKYGYYGGSNQKGGVS